MKKKSYLEAFWNGVNLEEEDKVGAGSNKRNEIKGN